MAPTFGHIAGAEPSTVTFKAATIVQTRNSSNMHQEIVSLGDPNSSLGVAAVANSAPASNSWALAVRLAGGPSSVVDCAIRSVLSSTSTDNPVSAAQAGTWTVKVSSTSTDNPVAASQAGSWTVKTKTALTGQAPVAATMGVASAQIVASNALRKGLVLTNSGTDIVWLGLDGNAAVVGSGVGLFPGGVLNMNEYLFTTGQINGISLSAAQNIGVQELQ